MKNYLLVSNYPSLSDYPIFSDLTTEQLQKILDICIEESFLPGSELHKAGDTAMNIFFILDGAVEEELHVGDVLLSIYKPLRAGDVTGCSAILPPAEHSCTARAITETSVLAIDTEGLKKLFDEDCALARALLLHVIGSLHQRLRRLELGEQV
jgi:CRP-like cAMP-binding protein